MTPKEKQILYSILSIVVLLAALMLFRGSEQPRNERLAAALEQSWPQFQKSLPVYTESADGWLLDGIQIIGPDVLLVQFGDGRIGHVVVVKYEGGTFESEGVFKDRMTFDQQYYADVLQYFGDTHYKSASYIPEKGDGLKEVRDNILLSQNN